MIFRRKIEKICFSLIFFIVIMFFFGTPSLFAGGSREYSNEYQESLMNLFKESILKVEAGEIDSQEAKAEFSLLRSKYRVDYTDFAGKIDALIDEVGEKKKNSHDAINEFINLKNLLVKVRKNTQTEIRKKSPGSNTDSQQRGNFPDGGSGNSHKKN